MHHDGRVVVTKPASVSVARAEGFVFSRFDWIAATIDKFKLKPQKLLSHFSAADYAARKAEALAMVRERVKHLNEIYGFEIGKIAVRNQRTRWGSCSGKKNLNFNYKLLYPPAGTLRLYRGARAVPPEGDEPFGPLLGPGGPGRAGP